MIVLINSASASASEDLALGFQELGRATIIGEKTFGNLLVGSIKLLPNSAVQMYSGQAIITLKGVLVEGRGVLPDIEVKLNRENLLLGGDLQLQTAIDFINQKTQ